MAENAPDGVRLQNGRILLYTLAGGSLMEAKDLRPYKDYKWVVADPRLLGD